MIGGYRIARLALTFVLAASSFSSHLSAKTRSPTRATNASTFQRDIVLHRGESLDIALRRAGIDANQRASIEKALEASRNPRNLAIGSHIILTFRRESAKASRLIALHLDINKQADVTLVAQPDGRFGSIPPQPSNAAPVPVSATTVRSVMGVIGADFQASLLAAGILPNVAQEIRSVFAYDPDFPAKPPVGSRFDIVVEADPRAAAPAESLRSAIVTIRGREHRVYRYPIGNGLVAFVEPNGRGVLQAHLAKPVTDARISSPWGWRIHPILDRPEFHKGIDMAAPMGTPVLAAADGTVAFAGLRGNNGMLIKLEHTGQLMTAYSHLERVASGLHPGSHVVKGQVIGYVGKTGLATGPHLYYEVYVAGEQVNPAKTNFAVPIHLAGGDLQRLQKLVIADSSTAHAGPARP
jgi:murein DD-endopeptidase MepM/ murein hydrolase activator NlpD